MLVKVTSRQNMQGGQSGKGGDEVAGHQQHQFLTVGNQDFCIPLIPGLRQRQHCKYLDIWGWENIKLTQVGQFLETALSSCTMLYLVNKTKNEILI